MSIKYGELTIMYYYKEESIITNFLPWLKQEPINKENKFIFLFDDGEICEYDKQSIDYNYYFCKAFLIMPLYFEKKIYNDKKRYNTYFYKEINQNCILNFTELFSAYSKYDLNIIIPSDYNSIYNCYKNLPKPDIFGIIRIKSTELMPRYQFAYDSNEFSKQEIIYLIHCIFNTYTSKRL